MYNCIFLLYKNLSIDIYFVLFYTVIMKERRSVSMPHNCTYESQLDLLLYAF